MDDQWRTVVQATCTSYNFATTTTPITIIVTMTSISILHKHYAPTRRVQQEKYLIILLRGDEQ